MQTFFIVAKAIGDVALPIAGVVLGICTVSPSVATWLLKQEEVLKGSLYFRRTLGVILIGFCSVYVAAVIYLPIQQSKEQSPLYQSQLQLKFHAKQVSNELRALANEYEKSLALGAFEISQMKKVELETYYGNRLEPRVENIINDLDREGLHTNRLENIFIVFPGVNELRAIAGHIDILAEQLPKEPSR